MAVIRVSSSSRTPSVAGAIAGMMRENGTSEILCIGAATINIGVKAIAVAREFLAKDRIDIACIPVFETLFINGNERTAIKFIIFNQKEKSDIL